MLSLDVGEEGFFDCEDYLTSEECFDVKEDLRGLGYEIWLNEPMSVEERRVRFLREMGLVEVDRVVECSGAVSSSILEESFICERMEIDGETNSPVDECDELSVCELHIDSEKETVEHSSEVHVCESNKVDVTKKISRSWWKQFTRRMRKSKKTSESDGLADGCKFTRVKVRQNKKQYMELSAVYGRQEIIAHKGLIWTMKFSPDGQFLASGGEDGVVRIWRVRSIDTLFKSADFNYVSPKTSGMKRSIHAPLVLPDKVLHIEESPVQEFHGHSSDVLDLSWSSSTLLLSSSKDKTVRLWQVGSEECVDVFNHSDYVTCVQFNPVDENYFISGSIDGKVRIWGVRERRVVNWVDVHDIVTTLCYQPNAEGFVVGLVCGTCRFYEASGSELSLHAELQMGRKKSSRNRITGIQFLENDLQKVMITSEDSKIRILDRLEVVHKYKGLAKSGSQMSASFTSTGNHIVSVGEDSRIYIWNHDEIQNRSSKQVKSVRSCEHFFSDSVSVAIPWSAPGTEQKGLYTAKVCSCLQKQDHHEASSERFSLTNWFSMDISSRGSVTWPEETLPSPDLPSEDCHRVFKNGDESGCGKLSTTCGLVIVTAGLDGTIRTFQNYGLPVQT